jgi:hypothetical protein
MGNDVSSINHDAGRSFDSVTSTMKRELDERARRQRELDEIARKAREEYEQKLREKHHSHGVNRDPSVD